MWHYRRCRAGKERGAGGALRSLGPEPAHRGAAMPTFNIWSYLMIKRQTSNKDPGGKRLSINLDMIHDEKSWQYQDIQNVPLT